MKKFIGDIIATIGAHLWEHGGFWTCDESYENLKLTGKIGYNMFIKGLEMMGITPEDINNIIKQSEEKESC